MLLRDIALHAGLVDQSACDVIAGKIRSGIERESRSKPIHLSISIKALILYPVPLYVQVYLALKLRRSLQSLE